MTIAADKNNPFTVQTPEDITAEDTLELFVDVFSDFDRVPHVGHCFLHGPRGSGKSMMFRFLQPDCQCLDKKLAIRDLPFLGIYVPIKNTALDIAELARLEQQHAAVLLNEHFLTTYIAVRAFLSLAKLELGVTGEADFAEAKRFYEEDFLELIRDCGWQGTSLPISSTTSVHDIFATIERVCSQVFRGVTSYLKQLSFQHEPATYSGPLFSFSDFLLPLFSSLSRLPFMPKGPVYLLVDDADNLNLLQTQILNSWVSSRTSSKISIKVSTQLNYKTYSTVTGRTIDSPHDYAEVSITDVYTSQRSPYRHRVRDIVQKRLKTYGFDTTPEQFFPSNAAQDEAIRRIAEQIKKQWEAGNGSGYRADDDVSRYSRPDYIRSLKGSKKQGSNYSYAGFSQLVDISSGIIRYFLEAAALMFTKEKASSGRRQVTHIRHQIQSDVVRELADKYMFSEFDRISLDHQVEISLDGTKESRAILLRNLIQSMGRTFSDILLSDRSERRVFSIALYDTPSPEVAAVLSLGVQYGYFHQSSIGNKDGTGRTWLYVLSRRLAPFFTLDPTGFAGYLFVKSDDLAKAMKQPGVRLRNLRVDSGAEQEEPYQLPLFV